MHCSCPDQRAGICKHLVAGVLLAEEKLAAAPLRQQEADDGMPAWLRAAYGSNEPASAQRMGLPPLSDAVARDWATKLDATFSRYASASAADLDAELARLGKSSDARLFLLQSLLGDPRPGDSRGVETALADLRRLASSSLSPASASESGDDDARDAATRWVLVRVATFSP